MSMRSWPQAQKKREAAFGNLKLDLVVMCESSFVDIKLSDKLRWSLPWLLRYPFWRSRELLRSLTESNESRHLVFLVANHFEPGLGPEALARVESWCKLARATGSAVRDHDGTSFRHTNFFPAEQYER